MGKPLNQESVEELKSLHRMYAQRIMGLCRTIEYAAPEVEAELRIAIERYRGVMVEIEGEISYRDRQGKA